ncbi:sigma-54-dependent Fis family transcriptional regulator [bacterium]|nr:sigma-54-dependent Fis family transcriptional regulator [bacterium]
MKLKKIMIVDDEKAIRWSLGEALKNAGYETRESENAKEALETFIIDPADLVILDLKLPDLNGLEVLRKLKKIDETIPVIMMTAYGQIETAVEAIRCGAYDFILKPFQLEKMMITIKNAFEKSKLKDELNGIRKKNRESHNFKNFIGKSDLMLKVFERVKKIGASKASTILIQGESGTGKELVARAIHDSSAGKDCAFMEINCAALPETLLESELFGHERGAFTDAKYRKKGLFELAEGGTIFLDEIGEMGITLQSRLLRVIENKTFRRVGGVKDLTVNTRIISATNRDLKQEINKGNFRNDLYYRLQVIPILLPPLRDRPEDIPLLANHFISIFNKEFKKNIEPIGNGITKLFQNYLWPGNVRELKNIIERAVLLDAESEIMIEYLPLEIKNGSSKEVGDKNSMNIDQLYPLSLKEMEKLLITKTLEKTNGNKSESSRILGISRQTLRDKVKSYNV